MFLAIDIGGTKTLLALFSPHGLCLKRLKFPTDKDPRAFEKALFENLRAFLPSPFLRSRIKAITIAIPGVVKIEQDSCSFKFGNLDWPKIDLLTPIKKLFSTKVFFANDANLATLYESTRPGRTRDRSVYLTFSTGIGGGVAENRHLLPSSDVFEPGHVKYPYKNQSLEWEDLASAKALIEAYGLDSIQNLDLSNPETLNDLILRLSLGLLDIIDEYSPATVIIGGPLGFIFNRLKKPLLDSLRAKLSSVPKFKIARRPTESVIYGAYLYSKQNYKR